jgi:hypothetical protein
MDHRKLVGSSKAAAEVELARISSLTADGTWLSAAPLDSSAYFNVDAHALNLQTDATGANGLFRSSTHAFAPAKVLRPRATAKCAQRRMSDLTVVFSLCETTTS